MTKSELQRYTRINVELERLEEKIAELRKMIESPKSPVLSGMPRGGVRKDTADYICKLMELQQLYNIRWDELIDERIRIERAIDTLSDPVERTLMGYRYIDGLTWGKIAKKMSLNRMKYSTQHIKGYLHDQALKNIKS